MCGSGSPFSALHRIFRLFVQEFSGLEIKRLAKQYIRFNLICYATQLEEKYQGYVKGDNNLQYLTMFRNCVFRLFNTAQTRRYLYNADYIKTNRKIHCGICLRKPRNTSKPNSEPPRALANKYQVLTDTNSPIIENTADEILSEEKYPFLSDEFDGINLERGKTGVFEINDLVELLQRENSKDIFVASVPENIRYVDYICIVTARSKRHILALTEFVRRVYKKKCNKSDPIPRIEGKDSDEWMALDLGNIALHVFSEKVRAVYDLETLWSVGPEFDDKMNKNSEVVDVFENYSAYLRDLKPIE